MVGGGRFQTDGTRVDAEDARQVVADGFTIGREPRHLREQRHIDILHRPFGAPAVVGHLAQQVEAAGILVLRIVIGKEGADVTNASRATKRVDQGVADHVGIAVPLEPHIPGKLDAAQHQPSTDDQPVQVEAGSYTHKGSAASKAATISASSWVATLMLILEPAKTLTGFPSFSISSASSSTTI